MSEKQSFFETMPPKFAFWAGVVASAAVISIIGFIIMLVLVLDEPEDSDNAADSEDAADVAAAVQANNAGTGDSVSTDSLRETKGSGSITLIEYSDVDCPYCQRFHTTTKQLVDSYGDRVSFSFKHFPLQSLHPSSPEKAEAAECGREQGKFWEMLDALFTEDTSSPVEDGELTKVATVAGLDTAQFEDCLASGKYTDLVSADASEAQRLGGNGTPFSVIIDSEGNVLDTISGALQYDVMTERLDQYLN